MTNQEAFDRMVTHLRKQGGKSEAHDGMCVYRAPSGRRCAVGVLITDEFYLDELEGQLVRDEQMRLVLNKAIPGVDLGLLDMMQEVHDKVAVCYWEENWKKVAERYHLIMPVLEEEEVPCALSSASE